MQYVFLIYRDEERFMDVPHEEMARRIQGIQGVLNETTKNGSLVVGVRLEDTTESRTARHREGPITVSDGPFSETKEFLAGLMVIDCKSESEAEFWAKRLTESSLPGTIEYRRVAGLYPAMTAPDQALAETQRA